MKNIRVSKKVWKQVKKLRNELGFKRNSKTIQWLLNRSLKEGDLQKTKNEKTLPNLEEIIKIEEHVDQLQLLQLKHEPISAEAFPDNISFLCLCCGQDFIFKKENQSLVEGLRCQICGFHHGIQIYDWLPNLEDENETKT